MRAVLDARGLDAFRDHIVVANAEPMAMAFRKPGAYEIEGAVPW